MAGSSSSFRGAEWWRRVHRPHTKVVAIDATTTATHRWTDGARGRGFRSVWGNGRWGRPRLSRGLSGGGTFIAHTPKSSPSMPPPPPLIGGQTVHVVEGSEWLWGNGWRGRPRLSGGPSGGGAFVAHTPKLKLAGTLGFGPSTIRGHGEPDRRTDRALSSPDPYSFNSYSGCGTYDWSSSITQDQILAS
jgi:hypothetical protein